MKLGLEEVFHPFIGAFERQRLGQEDDDEHERQSRGEIAHLRRRLDALPDGKVDQNPRTDQTRHQLPPQTVEVFDAVADLEHLLTRIKMRIGIFRQTVAYS